MVRVPRWHPQEDPTRGWGREPWRKDKQREEAVWPLVSVCRIDPGPLHWRWSRLGHGIRHWFVLHRRSGVSHKCSFFCWRICHAKPWAHRCVDIRARFLLVTVCGNLSLSAECFRAGLDIERAGLSKMRMGPNVDCLGGGVDC